MNKKCEIFLNYFDELVKDSGKPMPNEAQEFYIILKEQQNISNNKSILTESGFQILEYLQSCNGKNLKAKDIADGMNVPSRKISGAMRKLVSDGFVEKFGNNPVIYNLSDKGREFNLKEYNNED